MYVHGFSRKNTSTLHCKRTQTALPNNMTLNPIFTIQTGLILFTTTTGMAFATTRKPSKRVNVVRKHFHFRKISFRG